MFHAVVHHAHHSSPTIFKFFSLSTSICLCIYILYICIRNNRKYNYIMNIQAFVRGGNAVVINKKSHGLHYTPIHETIVPVGSSNRPVLYTCVFCALCVWLLYLHFYSSCRTYTSANRSKEIKKKRIGKTTLFVPSSISSSSSFYSLCSSSFSQIMERNRSFSIVERQYWPRSVRTRLSLQGQWKLPKRSYCLSYVFLSHRIL